VGRRDNGFAVYLAVAIIPVALYYVFTTMAIPDMPATLGATFGTILPGLILSGVAIAEAAWSKNGMGAMGGYTIAGVGLALLLYELTVAGMVSAAMLAPATLDQIQTLIIVLGLVMGVIAYRS
jgi:hypothetical protein